MSDFCKKQSTTLDAFRVLLIYAMSVAPGSQTLVVVFSAVPRQLG